MTASKRKIIFQVLGGVVVAVVGLFLIGVGVGFFAAHREASGAPIDTDAVGVWVVGGFTTLMMIGALVVSVIWMRSIDEAAREAHKSAWFWGGSGGMTIGLIVVAVAAVPGAENWSIPAWYSGRTDPAAYAATGAFGMLILMIIGYAIAWAWWWLARTRG